MIKLPLQLDDRTDLVRRAVHAGERLGLITSIDGSQLITLLLAPQARSVLCYETETQGSSYRSITSVVPQAHWFERTMWDMFGLFPEGHMRLKRTVLHEPYAFSPAPLAGTPVSPTDSHEYEFLEVAGEGVYELPVGPIHAGIIEPGHFRFSCHGEVIVNLEIRLGYVHRGVERRLAETPWQKTNFVAEAAASDMAVANALACATVIESLAGLEVPRPIQAARTIALEVERMAMHVGDLGGLAGDIGFLAVSSSMARLRGLCLRLGELLGGTRFMRGFVRIGGLSRALTGKKAHAIRSVIKQFKPELALVCAFLFENQAAILRMEGVGKVSQSLAREFGLVGVAGRACGSQYDCRASWSHGLYPELPIEVCSEQGGDVLARARVRAREIQTSLKIMESLLDGAVDGTARVPLPDKLPADAVACSIVESHRGELIHFVVTDSNGSISRYCIKDPSVNNWTGLAIAVRNNVVADFPLCNKSFSLSYSGHDL